jgi:hypothetical protein
VNPLFWSETENYLSDENVYYDEDMHGQTKDHESINPQINDVYANIIYIHG